MYCELCGKKLEFSEYDKVEGIVWFKCPDFDKGTDEHSAPGVNIDLREVAEKNISGYLTADFGQRLVIDFSGNVYFQDSSTFSRDEIVSVKCPGVNNLDSTYFTEEFAEWDEDKGAYVTIPPQPDAGRVVGGLEDVIRECCETGDVTGFIEDLETDLIAAL
jgi:hypothetical protein